MSVGLPSLQREALQAAARWYSVLGAETCDSSDRQAWRDWLLDPVNQWAWQRIELLQQNLRALPGKLAVDTFDLAAQQRHLQRRSVLKGIALLAGAGTLGWSSSRYLPAPVWLADHRTAPGEIRSFMLPDGSSLLLNTGSAVDIRFDERQRLVVLRQGEILIETARDAFANSRPFLVETRQGRLRALGTKFSVRQFDEYTRVAVQADRVEILAPAQHLIDAGSSAEFTREEITAKGAFAANDSAWRNGMLIADNWRLDKFLHELARYRSGIVRCDPAIAEHRISGAFRIDDTDQALAAVSKLFPVSIDYRTRFWVVVRPAKKV